MNTRIEYQYRDGSNYKQPNEAVVAGEMTPEYATRIAEHMFEGNGFVPRQVGLPEKRIDERLTDDDLAFFEWDVGVDDNGQPFGYTLTEETPTVSVTVEQLVANFEKIEDDLDWDMTSWENDYK